MPTKAPAGENKHIDLAVANRLKIMRKVMGFTAVELDRRCGYGPGTIGRLERGDQRIYANHLYRLSEITGVGIDFFYNDIDAPPKPLPAASQGQPENQPQMPQPRLNAVAHHQDIQEIIERLMEVLGAGRDPLVPGQIATPGPVQGPGAPDGEAEES